MGEAACLRRSFSNPSEISHEFSEGDPIRALGESISFGRYMSETLNWEKWSTFSQNRYLEEAEKSSKPGSVAKMKAYFEAHYKKVGAKKQQAALEQASYADSYVETEVEDIHNMELVSSSSSPALNHEMALRDSHLTVHISPKKEIPNVEPLPSVIISSCDYFNQTKELQKEEGDVVESISDTDSKELLPVVQEQKCEDAEVTASIMESCVEIKVNQSIDAMGDSVIPIILEVIVEKEAKEDKLDPGSKRKSADSSSRSTKKSNMSKLSSSLARLATPVRHRKAGSGTVTNQKSAMESVEIKKSTSILVQKSIILSSDVKPVKKSSPASYKTGIGKVFTPLSKMIRQSIVQTPAPSTCRASVNSVSLNPSATPLSATRRNMKSAAPSSITFSPFSFRTEERAAKRKEFFERRLDKEAENLKFLDKAKIPLACTATKTRK